MIEEIETVTTECLQNLWLDAILKQRKIKKKDERPTSPIQPFAQMSYEENQERRLRFVRICTKLESRLLICQPYIRASVAASQVCECELRSLL